MIEFDMATMARLEEEHELANSQTSANLESLTLEVNYLAAQIAQNAVLIGRKLNEMKQLLPHGEFMPYIESHCGFKQRMANQFMRIAAEYTVDTLPVGLGVSKVYELLALPAGDREEFIASHDAESMTVRQLREEIRRMKQEGERQMADMNSKLDVAEEKARDLQKQLDDEVDFSDKVEAELRAAKQREDQLVESAERERTKFEAARDNLAYSDQQLREAREKLVSVTRAYDREKTMREELVDEGHQMSSRIDALIAANDEAMREVEKARKEQKTITVEVLKEVAPADYESYKQENEELKKRLDRYEHAPIDMNNYVNYLMSRVDDAEDLVVDIIADLRGIISNNRPRASTSCECFRWLNQMVTVVEGYVNDIRTSITACAASGEGLCEK